MNFEGLSIGGLSLSVSSPKRRVVQKQHPSNVPTLPPIAKMKEMCTPSSSSSASSSSMAPRGSRNNALVLNRRVGAPQQRHQKQQQQQLKYMEEQELAAGGIATAESGDKVVQAVDDPVAVESILEFRDTMTNGDQSSSPLIVPKGSPKEEESTNDNNDDGRTSQGQGQTTKAPQPKQSKQPKSMNRAKQWTPQIENFFRFQEAGYRCVFSSSFNLQYLMCSFEIIISSNSLHFPLHTEI